LQFERRCKVRVSDNAITGPRRGYDSDDDYEDASDDDDDDADGFINDDDDDDDDDDPAWKPSMVKFYSYSAAKFLRGGTQLVEYALRAEHPFFRDF